MRFALLVATVARIVQVHPASQLPATLVQHLQRGLTASVSSATAARLVTDLEALASAATDRSGFCHRQGERVPGCELVN